MKEHFFFHIVILEALSEHGYIPHIVLYATCYSYLWILYHIAINVMTRARTLRRLTLNDINFDVIVAFCIQTNY